jgi:hypothetical protein
MQQRGKRVAQLVGMDAADPNADFVIFSTYRNRLKTGTRAQQGVFLESMYCCLSPAGASLLQGRRGYPLLGVPKVR